MKRAVMENGVVTERQFPDVPVGSPRARLNPTTISAAIFFARFTDLEKAAIWTAAAANPALGVGLIHGLAVGTIDLTSPELLAWMDGLVSAGAITADRKSEILTP